MSDERNDGKESAATPAAASTAPAITPPVSPALSKGQLVGGAALLGASLLLSLAALWMGMSLDSQIETLNGNVTELQQRVLAQSHRDTLPTPAQLGGQLNLLDERVNELAMIVEGPLGHLRESNQQALQTLDLRLERLEKGQTTLPLAAKQKKQENGSKAQTTSSPLLSKGAEAATTPASKLPSNTAAVKKGWVINLLSVTSAKTAKEELARLRKMGIRADKQTMNKEGKSWYRLRVTGFDSYEGAKAYIETVEKQTGFSSAWVAKE